MMFRRRGFFHWSNIKNIFGSPTKENTMESKPSSPISSNTSEPKSGNQDPIPEQIKIKNSNEKRPEPTSTTESKTSP